MGATDQNANLTVTVTGRERGLIDVLTSLETRLGAVERQFASAGSASDAAFANTTAGAKSTAQAYEAIAEAAQTAGTTSAAATRESSDAQIQAYREIVRAGGQAYEELKALAESTSTAERASAELTCLYIAEQRERQAASASETGTKEVASASQSGARRVEIEQDVSDRKLALQLRALAMETEMGQQTLAQHLEFLDEMMAADQRSAAQRLAIQRNINAVTRQMVLQDTAFQREAAADESLSLTTRAAAAQAAMRNEAAAARERQQATRDMVADLKLEVDASRLARDAQIAQLEEIVAANDEGTKERAIAERGLLAARAAAESEATAIAKAQAAERVAIARAEAAAKAEATASGGLMSRGAASEIGYGVGTFAGMGSGYLLQSMLSMAPEMMAMTAAFSAAFGAVKFVTDGVKAAADLEATENRLTQALHNQGVAAGEAMEKIKAFADEQQRTTRFDDQDVLNNVLQLVNAGLSYADALKIVRVAEDAAASGTKSLTQVTHDLMEAAHGNARALTDLGIATADAKTHGLDLHEVLRLVEQQMGGQATAAAQGYNANVQKLEHSIGDIEKTLGKDLLPTLTEVVKQLDDSARAWSDNKANIDSLDKGVNALVRDGKGLIEFVSVLADFGNTVGEIFGGMNDVLASWGKGVHGWFTAIGQVSLRAIEGVAALKDLMGDKTGAAELRAGVKFLFTQTVSLGEPTAAEPVGPKATDGLPTSLRAGSMPYDNQLLAIAARIGVDPAFALAIQRAENYAQDPHIKSPDVGAIGLMQVMPGKNGGDRVIGGIRYSPADLEDPIRNLTAGITYIKELAEKYGHDHDKVAAAYNAGPAAVDKYGGTPPYRETQKYVVGVRAWQGMPVVDINTVSNGHLGGHGDDSEQRKRFELDFQKIVQDGETARLEGVRNWRETEERALQQLAATEGKTDQERSQIKQKILTLQLEGQRAVEEAARKAQTATDKNAERDAKALEVKAKLDHAPLQDPADYDRDIARLQQFRAGLEAIDKRGGLSADEHERLEKQIADAGDRIKADQVGKTDAIIAQAEKGQKALVGLGTASREQIIAGERTVLALLDRIEHSHVSVAQKLKAQAAAREIIGTDRAHWETDARASIESVLTTLAREKNEVQNSVRNAADRDLAKAAEVNDAIARLRVLAEQYRALGASGQGAYKLIHDALDKLGTSEADERAKAKAAERDGYARRVLEAHETVELHRIGVGSSALVDPTGEIALQRDRAFWQQRLDLVRQGTQAYQGEEEQLQEKLLGIDVQIAEKRIDAQAAVYDRMRGYETTFVDGVIGQHKRVGTSFRDMLGQMLRDWEQHWEQMAIKSVVIDRLNATIVRMLQGSGMAAALGLGATGIAGAGTTGNAGAHGLPAIVQQSPAEKLATDARISAEANVTKAISLHTPVEEQSTAAVRSATQALGEFAAALRAARPSGGGSGAAAYAGAEGDGGFLSMFDAHASGADAYAGAEGDGGFLSMFDAHASGADAYASAEGDPGPANVNVHSVGGVAVPAGQAVPTKISSMASGAMTGLMIAQLVNGFTGGNSTWSSVGGAVGGAFGGPIGAAIGSALGGLFGHKDDPAKMPDVYNPAWGQADVDWNGAAGAQTFGDKQFTAASQFNVGMGGTPEYKLMEAWANAGAATTDAQKAILAQVKALEAGNPNADLGVVREADGMAYLANGQTIKATDLIALEQSYQQNVGSGGLETSSVFQLTRSYPDFDIGKLSPNGTYTASPIAVTPPPGGSIVGTGDPGGLGAPRSGAPIINATVNVAGSVFGGTPEHIATALAPHIGTAFRKINAGTLPGGSNGWMLPGGRVRPG